MALLLEKAGIDLLELSGGNYDSNIFKENDVEGKEVEIDKIIDKYQMKRSTALREAYFIKYARDVMTALKSVDNKSGTLYLYLIL